ncbi:hypothetical protein JAAARDRAFT_34074 [Jaapia argillacea MUCL 33604]|uniref:Fungal N-terminal domain-containing protein n=1 Tax=Jaapia argillacea MUCL 33604 TaxID=933084 RepID=A0A067PWY4_9AGAM|nr:hypothetical protein JAAARDRAFT_34074 [Jaapia argillacea MUCL 33604]
MPPNWNERLSRFILILRTAQTAAQFAPFPQVQQVTGLVLQLLESVDKVQRCKGDCESLALRALEMVSAILSEAQNHGPLSLEMESRVVKLAEVLNDITRFMREQAKAPFMRRFLRQVNMQDQLDGYRVRLEDAFKLFDSTSLIGMQRSLDVLQNVAQETKNLQISLATDIRGLSGSLSSSIDDDGDFRVYKRSDIDLIESIGTTYHGSVISGTLQCIIRSHKAKLGDRVVVVRTYEGPQSARARARDIRNWGQIWHPTLAQLLGYSKETSAIPFVVLNAGTITAEEFMSNMDPISQVGHACRMTREYMDAQRYLAERHLNWQGYNPFRDKRGRPVSTVDKNGHLILGSGIVRVRKPTCGFEGMRFAPDGIGQGNLAKKLGTYVLLDSEGKLANWGKFDIMYREVERAIAGYTPESDSDAQLVLGHWLDLIGELQPSGFEVKSHHDFNLGDVIFCDDISPSGDNIYHVLGPYRSSHSIFRQVTDKDGWNSERIWPEDVNHFSRGGKPVHGLSDISFHASGGGWTSLKYESQCPAYADEYLSSSGDYPTRKWAFAALVTIGKHTAAKYGRQLDSIGIVTGIHHELYYGGSYVEETVDEKIPQKPTTFYLHVRDSVDSVPPASYWSESSQPGCNERFSIFGQIPLYFPKEKSKLSWESQLDDWDDDGSYIWQADKANGIYSHKIRHPARTNTFVNAHLSIPWLTSDTFNF